MRCEQGDRRKGRAELSAKNSLCVVHVSRRLSNGKADGSFQPKSVRNRTDHRRCSQSLTMTNAVATKQSGPPESP
jgi:hypothetical protein